VSSGKTENKNKDKENHCHLAARALYHLVIKGALKPPAKYLPGAEKHIKDASGQPAA